MESKPCEFLKHFLPEISSHHLKIPKSFFQNYSGPVPTNAILRVSSGNIWRVKLKANSYNSWFIQDGWESFVSDNHLVDGDCLLFRYDLASLFDVTLFSRDGCYKDVGARSSIPITPQVNSSRDANSEKDVTRREILGFSTSFGKVEEDAAKTEVCVGNSGAVLVRKSYLTSGFFHIPKQMQKTCFGNKDQTIKVQVGTRFWEVNYRNGNFIAGWGAFRRDIGLQEGDECRFKVTGLDPIVMQVTVIRSF